MRSAIIVFLAFVMVTAFAGATYLRYVYHMMTDTNKKGPDPR